MDTCVAGLEKGSGSHGRAGRSNREGQGSQAGAKETTANILKQEDDLRILSNRENVRGLQPVCSISVFLHDQCLRQTVRRQFSQAKEKMKKVKRDGERALQEAQLRMTSKQQVLTP
jgi:hypothetical protein